MRRILREVANLKKTPPEGIRVQTSEENIFDITGIIEGPGESYWRAEMTRDASDNCSQREPLTLVVTLKSSLDLQKNSLHLLPNVRNRTFHNSGVLLFTVFGTPGWFATKIFHPNVSSSGEICVNTLKKDWKSTYGVEHILVTVKCLLIYPNPESALDEEAGKLLL